MGFVKTVENDALTRIYRKDLTVPKTVPVGKIKIYERSLKGET